MSHYLKVFYYCNEMIHIDRLRLFLIQKENIYIKMKRKKKKKTQKY
jgi:hypothetical protein